MLPIKEFIPSFYEHFPSLKDQEPWQITADLSSIVSSLITQLDSNFIIKEDVAIHKTAVVEEGAVVKGPAIIGANCFVGAHAYLRGGVVLGSNVRIGTGCEIKASIIMSDSAIAHFNFIGDSIIGSHVNFEAGSITANHFNERTDKNIVVVYQGASCDTGCNKFGALVGDSSKVGANAVLSPGTILSPGSIVKRLELVEQFPM